MKKIDITVVCEAYNKARLQNAGRKGGSKWATEILKSFGISNNMARKIVHEPTLLIPCRRENSGKGNYKGFVWPMAPIHISWFQNWLSPKEISKKEQSFEEECAEYLRKKGYQLKKCVGFDEEAFKEAYPQLWEKFLIYEEV